MTSNHSLSLPHLGWLRLFTMLIALFGIVGSLAVAQDIDELPMRRVFVPVDDLDALIARDQRGVLLPKDEFLKLYRDAQKNVPADQKAPVGVVVSGATYSARFDGEQLLVTAEIKLVQLRDSWQAIPLPLAGMSVEQAMLDGQAAKLGRADQNLFLLSDAKGEHTLTLELSAPLNAVGADKLVSLGVLPGIAAKLKVAVPAGKHLQFDELSVERPAAADQPANYELAVGGQRNLVALQLTDRQRERATDSLLFATTGFGLRVAPGEVTWHAVTALQVHGTPLDRLVCVVPKTLEITDVDSNGLEAWELSDNPDDATTTRITLNYRQSFDGARRIDFRGVMAVPAGEAWHVPTLRINQVTSHIGRALIQHAPAVRLRTVESTGVRTATVSDVDLTQIGTAGATEAGQVSLLFDVWQEKFTLGFVAQPKEQTVQASIASIFDLTAHGLDLITAATVETSFAPLFEIELSLPAEWLITQVTFNGQPLRWEVQPREPGTNHIRVPLPQPLKPGVEAKLQINAHRDPDDWPVEDESVEVTLPELRFPQSSVTEGTYVIKADADLDVVPGEITGLDPANVAVPGTRLGFAYQDTRFSGTLKVDRKPSRVSARTLTFARLDKQTLHMHFEAELDISGGGLRVLEVALPETAGKDLRFQMVNVAGRIVEQTSRAGENGELIWTLRLDRHLVGTATLVVTSVVPRRLGTPARPDAVSNPEDTTGKSAHPPHLRILAADRQHGYIAIEAEGDQRLTVTAIDANKGSLPEVDPIDLPAPAAYAPTQRIVSAYRYFTGTPNLTVADERFDRLPVPTAICREAKITSILSAAGEFQHQAKFAFTAVGVQSLRVRLTAAQPQVRSPLPRRGGEGQGEGTERSLDTDSRSSPLTPALSPAAGERELSATLWAALVDGRPVEVRRTAEAFLIPLPASDDPTVERQLELFYRTRVPALRGTGELRQPPPELTVLNGAGVSQPMQVLDQQWELRYPQDLLLTDSKGAFIPDAPLRATSWLTRLPQSLTMPSWWNIQRMVTAVLLLFVVVGLIWSFIRWGFLKGFVAPVVLLALLSAFTLPMSIQSARNASRQLSPNEMRQRGLALHDKAGGFGFNDNADDGDGAVFFGLAATGDAPSTAGALMAEAPKVAAKPFEESFEQKQMAIPQAAAPQVEMDFAKPTDRQRTLERRGGTSKKDMELGRMVKNFNDLMDQKRYAEAEVIAKQAKELESDNPVAETMVYKSQLARRTGSNDKLKDAKEEGFWSALNSVEVAGVPHARGNTQGLDDLVDEVRALERGEAGGLLSLTMALEGQADAKVKKFRYLGTETAGSGIGLEIVYENRAAGWTGRWFWIAALAFVAWLIPPTARNVRVLWSVLGLTLPLALAPLAPLAWQNTLDGVFFGTLAALALWTSRCLCDAFCCALPRMKTKTFWTRSLSRNTSWLILGATLLGSVTSAFAQPAAAVPAPSPNPNPDVAAQPTIVVPYDDPKNPLAAERVFLPQAKFIELWNAAHPEQRVVANAPQEGLVAEALFLVTPLPKKADAEGPAFARVVARLTLFSFRSQQVVLPIPLRLTSLSEAKLDDKPAPIVVREEGAGSGDPRPAQTRLHVVLDKPGLHVLDLTAEIPIQQAGSAGQLLLSLDPLPSARLLFVPGGEVTFRVNGASNTFRARKGKLPMVREGEAPAEPSDAPTSAARQEPRPPGAEGTYYEVPVSAGGDVRLAWQPKQAVGAVDAIVQAESATAVQVEDAGVRIVSGWQFKVPRGSINDVSFSLPKELRVRSISGADVGGWELNENADGRALRVFLRRAVSDQTALAFELFMEAKIASEAVSIKVPAFAPLQVTRDFGVVGLFAAPQFALRNIATKGLTQINANQFVGPGGQGAGDRGQAVTAFRYTARPFEVSFAAGRKAPESTGLAEHALVVERRKVRMSSRLRWELAGALRSSVNVQLPPGWLAVDVDATALADWHVDAATNVLTVEFTEPRIGAVEVVLQGNVAKEPEDTLAEITLPVPQELSKLVTQTAVWFDPAYQATINASNGWKSSDPEHCSEELRTKLGRPAKFVFTSNALAPELLGFDLVRAVPKLSADAVTLLTVSDTAIDYSLALQWKITEAAADTFTFTTPDWLAGKLDFQGAGIRQTSFKSAGKDSGRTRWTVTLQDPVGSRFFLLATATLPPPEKRTVSAPTIAFERRDIVEGDAAAPAEEGEEVNVPHSPLETQRQFVVLINMSGNQVSPVGNVGETVPREELPIVVDQRLVDQAAAVLRVRSTDTSPTRKRVNGEQDAANNQQVAATPTWSLKSFAAQAGAPASVNLADLTTVLAADGTWRMQAIYTIKNRSRQFLALQLPEGSQALSVFVADQPARLVELKRNLKSEISNLKSQISNSSTYQLIALPKTSEADLSFQVKLVLAGRLSTGALPRGLKLWSQNVELPVPTVVSQSDDKEYGIPVARTLWTVHVPQEWSAYPLNDPQRHNLSQQADDTAEVAYRATWLQEANDLLRVVEGNYNSSQKLQARDNIKQLWSRIDSNLSSSSDEGRKLAESVQEFKGKQADLESRVIIENTESAGTNFYVAKDQQQATQARAAQQRDKNANGRLFFGQGGQQGGGFQRGIVNLNNYDILTSNSGSGVMNGEDRNGNGILDAGEDVNSDGVLNYGDVNDSLLGANVSGPDSGLKFKLNVKAGDKPVTRELALRASKSSGKPDSATKGVTEVDRANRRKQSVDQLQTLNRAVDNEKQVQQQAQQPTNQSGDFRNGAPVQQNAAGLGGFNVNAFGNGPRGEQSGRNWSEPSNRQRGRNGVAIGGGQQGGGGFGGSGQGGAMAGGGSFPTEPTVLSATANGPESGTVAMGKNLGLQIQQRQFLDGTVTAAGWSQTGGLSLPIEIQREGNVLRFSRASGAPRLALAVRPNESARLGLGLLWSAVWAVIAVWLLKVVRSSASRTSWRQVTCGLSVLGLLGMFFLPMPLSELCFLLFALSTIVLAIGVLRSKRQNAVA